VTGTTTSAGPSKLGKAPSVAQPPQNLERSFLVPSCLGGSPPLPFRISVFQSFSLSVFQLLKKVCRTPLPRPPRFESVPPNNPCPPKLTHAGNGSFPNSKAASWENEQHSISVQRLSLVEDLGSAMLANLQHAARLRQFILQKASPGELIENEG
jgi:hypothetical protein